MKEAIKNLINAFKNLGSEVVLHSQNTMESLRQKVRTHIALPEEYKLFSEKAFGWIIFGLKENNPQKNKRLLWGMAIGSVVSVLILKFMLPILIAISFILGALCTAVLSMILLVIIFKVIYSIAWLKGKRLIPIWLFALRSTRSRTPSPAFSMLKLSTTIKY